ncbi:MAG: cytochrome c biogenesis protein CcsA [Bacteroidota bacterium]
MKKYWNIGYKLAGIGIVLYVIIYGLQVKMPFNPIWGQSSRNLFLHVPMWFSEVVVMTISVVWSVILLRKLDPDRERKGNPMLDDAKARSAAEVGIIFNIIGLITGILWSRVTWGENIPSSEFSAWWVWDPIQVSALLSLLIYLGYFLLRSSFSEPEQRARIAAVYNIFAYATLIPLFFILPRMLPGLHPTAEQKMVKYDGSSYQLLLIAILGFSLIATWIWELRSRYAVLEERIQEHEAEQDYVSQSSVS